MRSRRRGGALLTTTKGVAEQLQETLKPYDETKEIDSLSARLGKARQILDYLKDEQELKDLEKRLPAVTEIIKSLEAAKAGLA